VSTYALVSSPAAQGELVEARLFVPATSAFFRGHFDGAPILPGVALLELVRRHARLDGRALDVGGLAGLRIRRPVGPGATLVVRTSPASGVDRVRFDVLLEGERAAEGVLSTTAPEAAGETETGTDLAVAPRDARDLLPHGDGARLVTRVLSHSDDALACEARVPEDSAFRALDSLSPFLALEMGAQAAAAHECLLAQAAAQDAPARPREGAFVGAKSATFLRPTLDAHALYTVAARRIGAAPPLFVYRIEVSADGRVIAHARISTHSV